MPRLILLIVGVLYIANGLTMWFAPQYWYDTTPGVAAMGPFNLHFIRDIALAYAVMGGGLLWGRRDVSVGMFACIWPALHAVYHIAIFFNRGMLIDIVSATNLFLIQIPAWASFWAVWRLRQAQSAK